MNIRETVVVLAALAVSLGFTADCLGAREGGQDRRRLIVVDSYHREYLWSQYVHEGFCEAMIDKGYFDDRSQATEFTENDYVETSRAVFRKLWMDSKRMTGKDNILNATLELSERIRDFKPDLIFLGEDNAVDCIGNQFLDSVVPVVFWGVNNTPVKYGLVDSEEKPGHNVTGIFQVTYFVESLEFLKAIVPSVKTFAVLSDDTTTGRIFAKTMKYLDRNGSLPAKLIDTVSTNDFDLWKEETLRLQKEVDAFFVAQYAGLKDKDGNAVPDEVTARWYVTNIKIPEAAGYRHRIVEGMLCGAIDSGFNQGYEAVSVAVDILENGADPSTYPPRAPKRGPLLVNRQRAGMLGITITDEMGAEEFVEKASALDHE